MAMPPARAKPGSTQTQRLWQTVTQTLVFATLASIYSAVAAWLFESTKGFTSQYLSKAPAPPKLELADSRCNRLKVKVANVKTSVFNEDEHQVAYLEDGQADSDSKLASWTASQTRVLAPLQHNTAYRLRARVRNCRGTSAWGPTIAAKTLLCPTDGGATCAGYTWTQSGIEVTVAFEVPGEVKAKDVSVTLRPSRLTMAYSLGGSKTVLVDAPLPGRVRSLTPDGGSYWELDRQGLRTVLRAVLEKEKAATNIKWGFWRSMFTGHPEIDTHVIETDPHVKPVQTVPGSAPGFDMQTVSRGELDELRSRVGGLRPSDVDDMPASLRQFYKQ